MPYDNYPISSLDYEFYTPRCSPPRSSNMSMYLIIGLVVLVVYMMQSPTYSPAMRRGGQYVTSMIGGLLAFPPGTVDAADSDVIPNVPRGLVTLIDHPQGLKDGEFYKKATKAQKDAAEKVLRDYLKNRTECVVMLYAQWCPHCHNQIPFFAALAKETKKTRPDLNFLLVHAEAMDRNTAWSGANAIFNLQYFPTFAVHTASGSLQAVDNAKQAVDMLAAPVSAQRAAVQEEEVQAPKREIDAVFDALF